MNVIVHTNEAVLFLWPTVSSGVVTLEVSATATGTRTAVDCGDVVINYSRRSTYSPIEIRVMDPSGYTTSVQSWLDQTTWSSWARQTTSPTYSLKTFAIPVPDDGELFVGVDISLSDGTAPPLRRPQVVIIKHNPN